MRKIDQAGLTLMVAAILAEAWRLTWEADGIDNSATPGELEAGGGAAFDVAALGRRWRVIVKEAP